MEKVVMFFVCVVVFGLIPGFIGSLLFGDWGAAIGPAVVILAFEAFLHWHDMAEEREEERQRQREGW